MKRKIAIEFLLLVAAFIISFIVFCLTYVYNSYRLNQIKKVDVLINERKKSVESILQVYHVKIEKQLKFRSDLMTFILQHNHRPTKNPWDDIDFYEPNPVYYLPSGNIDIFDTSLRYFKKNNKLHYDLISNFSEYGKHFSFSHVNDFKSFIKKNQIDDVDKGKFIRSKVIENECAILSKKKQNLNSAILLFDEQINLGIITLIILIGILFPLRYLYYAIRWSLNALKTENRQNVS